MKFQRKKKEHTHTPSKKKQTNNKKIEENSFRKIKKKNVNEEATDNQV